MKFLSTFLALAALAGVSATGSLPWIEDFAGLPDGTLEDSGDTAWSAVRGSGCFGVKDEKLQIKGGGGEGTIESSDIDVSGSKFVEVSTTIFGDGGLDSSGNYQDHVEVYAVLDNGRNLLIGYKVGGSNGFREDINGIIDVTGINTLQVKIETKTTGGTELYHFEEISVKEVGNDSDSCTYYDLNMDNLAEGVYVTDQFANTHGVTLECSCNSCGSQNDRRGECRVFDTSNPLGDPDLGSPNNKCTGGGPGVGVGGEPGKVGENCWPVGHILIVDENGQNSVPDDAVGGEVTFNFALPVEFLSIDQLDNEGSEHYRMHFYRSGVEVSNVTGAYTGDNGYAATPLLGDDTKDVDKMKLVLSGSGSVNSVKYRICDASNHAGGGGGDPHIKRWNRKSFEFHGECDLVLIHSDHVNGHQVLDVHIRTVIREWWSQIESAAMRIGDVTLQMEVDKLYVDGVEYSDKDLPIQTAEFYIAKPVEGNHHKQLSLRGTGKDVLKTYVVTFNDKSVVTFKMLNGFMNVEVSGHRQDFEQSVGLMGTYDHGKAYGRAGKKIPDLHDFAMDWQVDPSVDPILFLEAKGPQLPLEKCRMPGPEVTARRGRRLKANPALYDMAAEACASKGDEMEACMADVMATGDISMAILH